MSAGRILVANGDGLSAEVRHGVGSASVSQGRILVVNGDGTYLQKYVTALGALV